MNRSCVLAIFIVAVAASGAYLLTIDPEAEKRASGPPIVQVKVPVLDGEALEGEAVFNAKCATCHGSDAAGKDEVAPPLVHKIYEPSHHGDMAFLLAVRQGVRAHHWPFGDMPPVEGLTERDVAMIVAYVRTLQRENGIH